MSDSIYRRDAIDALGEEPDIWNDTEEEWAYRNAWVEHISAIKALPSADAVEVVRCKDCIHWFPHTQCGFDEDNDEYHDYCGLLIPDDDYYAFRRKPDDYCSYGERREP